MKPSPQLGRSVLLLAPLLLVACASAPSRRPAIVAEVRSEPPGLTVTFQGRRLGPAPLTQSIGTLAEATAFSAGDAIPPVVERRVRVLTPTRVEVTIRTGNEPTAVAKALGLARVIVFDYGEASTFEVNRYDLSSAARELLESQAQLLVADFPSIPIHVCGHTDSTGASEHNALLSLNRATAVADFLASHGVPSSRLKVQGLGPDYPVAPNTSPDGRALNRRTEIVLPD